MDLFYIKKRKLAKIEKENNLKLEEDLKNSMKIKRTIKSLKDQLVDIDKLKDQYLKKGQAAITNGDRVQAELAKNSYKTFLKLQKNLEQKIYLFEIMIQKNEFAKQLTGFVDSINLITKDMETNIKSWNLGKMSLDLNKALELNKTQDESLNHIMNDLEDNIFDEETEAELDKELDQLFSCGALDNESIKDSEIDATLDSIDNKILETATNGN